MFFSGSYKTIDSIKGDLEDFFKELHDEYSFLSAPPERIVPDDLFSNESLFLKRTPSVTTLFSNSPDRNRGEFSANNNASETQVLDSVNTEAVEVVLSAIRAGDDRFFDFVYYLIDKKSIYVTEVNEIFSLSESAATLWNFKYSLTAAVKEIIQGIRYGFSGGYVFYQIDRMPDDLSSYLGTLIFSKEDQQLYYIASDENARQVAFHLKDLSAVDLSRIKTKSIPIKNGSWMFLSVKQAHELTDNDQFRLESGVLCPADFFPGTTEERLSRTLNGLSLGEETLNFYALMGHYSENRALSFKAEMIEIFTEKMPTVLASLDEEALTILRRALRQHREENPDNPLPWLNQLSEEWHETEPEKITFSTEAIKELTVFLKATGKEDLSHKLMTIFEAQELEKTNRLQKIRDTNFCDDAVFEEAMDLLKRPILRVSENGYIINLQDCNRFEDAQPLFILENNDGYFRTLSTLAEFSARGILDNYMAYRKLSFPFPWWSDDVYRKTLLSRFNQVVTSLIHVFKKITFGRELDASDDPENKAKLDVYIEKFLTAIAFYLPLDETEFSSSYWAISLEERKNLPAKMKTFLPWLSRAEIIASDVLNDLKSDLSETMQKTQSRIEIEIKNDLTTLLLSKNNHYFDKIPLSYRDKLDAIVRAEHNINMPSKIFRSKQLKATEIQPIIDLISGSQEAHPIVFASILEKIQAENRPNTFLSEDEVKFIKDRLKTALVLTSEESRKKSLVALGKKLVCERTELSLELCRPIYERELKLLYNSVAYETVDAGDSTLLLLALQYGNTELFKKLFNQFSGGYEKINSQQVAAKHYDLNNFSEALREKDYYPQVVRYSEKKLRQYLEDWCSDAAKIARRKSLIDQDKIAALIDRMLQRLDKAFKMRTIFLSREEQVKKLIEIIDEARYGGWLGQKYIEEIEEVMETIDPGFFKRSSTLSTSNQLIRKLKKSQGPIDSVALRASYASSERHSAARSESVNPDDSSQFQARLSEFEQNLADERAEREREKLEAEARIASLEAMMLAFMQQKGVTQKPEAASPATNEPVAMTPMTASASERIPLGGHRDGVFSRPGSRSSSPQRRHSDELAQKPSSDELAASATVGKST